MESLKSFSKRLVKEESAQGATEYILLLVAVVAVVALFKDKIKEQVDQMLGKISGDINSVLQ